MTLRISSAVGTKHKVETHFSGYNNTDKEVFYRWPHTCCVYVAIQMSIDVLYISEMVKN